MIGEDSKIQVTEDGKVIKFYWGDTVSSVIYDEYSKFAKYEVIKFLQNNKESLSYFLSYCELTDYEKYQHESGNFILSIASFIKGSDAKKTICNIISEAFNKSSIMANFAKLENDINKSDLTIERILHF